jgi:hypothetical protein
VTLATDNHFPFAFSPPFDFREIPNRFADLETDSGFRPSPLATASSDFSEVASAIKRRSPANRPRLLRTAMIALQLYWGLTPSQDGRPKVSRRWETESWPRSGRLSSVASDASRASPTVLMPAAESAFLIRADNRTSPIGVSSRSSGVRSNTPYFPFAFGRSTRSWRNSGGPLVSRRRRWACSSSDASGSIIFSIALAASS